MLLTAFFQASARASKSAIDEPNENITDKEKLKNYYEFMKCDLLLILQVKNLSCDDTKAWSNNMVSLNHLNKYVNYFIVITMFHNYLNSKKSK